MLLLELPSTDYLKSLEIQHRIVERKTSKGGPDILMLLEHPPTVTLGVRAKESHLLLSTAELAGRGIAVHHVERGGEATYHGPGQLICYPIMDLKSHGLSARNYVDALEQTIILTLASFGIVGFRRSGMAGVWTGPTEKIASIGVRIQRRVTSHGFSLNVSVPIDPGELIISCGAPDVRMVSLNQFGQVQVTMESMRKTVVSCFGEVFGVTLEPCSVQTATDDGR